MKTVLNTIPKVLAENYCGRAVKYLKDNGFNVISYQGDTVMTAEEIKAVGKDVWGVMLGCDTWTAEVMDYCPNLKIIARFGIGLESVDLDAAKERGIIVVNARGMNSDSVAEMTVLQVLAVYRNLINLDKTTREGKWMRNCGRTIHNKVYGLIGFGAIAQNVANVLYGFGPGEILAFDKYPDKDAADKLGVTLVDLETLLRRSDIISIHVPATPETTNMINEKTLGMMKKEAVLVNVARGAVVDEAALYTALKERRIFGAGADVYRSEPAAADNPLFTLDNMVFTPHQAADTLETFDAVSYFDAKVIVDVMNGKEPINWMNR